MVKSPLSIDQLSEVGERLEQHEVVKWPDPRQHLPFCGPPMRMTAFSIIVAGPGLAASVPPATAHTSFLSSHRRFITPHTPAFFPLRVCLSLFPPLPPVLP